MSTSTMTTSTRATTLSCAPLPVSSSPATSTKKSMTASTDEFVQDNPELVQPENWRMMNNWSGRTPVFLIHDGGGTTFAYHCLEPLNRFTYGIRNPYFFSQKKFEDGIPEMGQLYADWIKAEVAKDTFPAKNKGQTPVEVMLGGWSLGGLLSLEIAHVLAEDPDVRIKGILMIDSVCPNELRRRATSNAMGSESEEGKTKNQILSSRSLTEARRMVGEWNMPRWDGHLLGKRPRMMLLKCRESVPLANGSQSVLDIDRADTDLGWEWYDKALFEEVVPIDGHHFSIFEQVNIPTVTKTIRSSLIKLDAF